jgi:hypothetical protein
MGWGEGWGWIQGRCEGCLIHGLFTTLFVEQFRWVRTWVGGDEPGDLAALLLYHSLSHQGLDGAALLSVVVLVVLLFMQSAPLRRAVG